MTPAVLQAKRLLDEENYMDAGAVINGVLSSDPDNPEALFLLGRAMLETDKPAFARLVYEHLVSRTDGAKRWQNWINLGKCYDDLKQHDKAQGCYRRVLKREDKNSVALRNVATSYVQTHNWSMAEKYAKASLAIADDRQCHIDLAYAYLNTGRYGEGWDEYRHGIGHMQWRNRKDYVGEPEWTGERCNVVITGEQGIGDQIAYMSCLDDARKLATFTAIDCYPKLRGLFQRTFPDIPVYPDMFKEELDWDPRPKIDASALMSVLPCYTRRTAEDYPSGEYLKTCPIRTRQWREYFATLPGKKIGLAWTGGIEKTGRELRSTTFETFAPLVTEGHTFVSLEYKPPGDIPIPHYPWATETNDYDDTAALVANLDLVICVPTSVAHLAGALGVPCWVIQHSTPHFFFADGCRIWKSVTNYQRKDGWSVIEQVKDDLRRFLAN